MRPRIVLITDPRYEDADLVRKLEAALTSAPKGSVLVQLRDKQRPASEVLALGERLRPLCKERGAAFIVNDRLDIALALDADGVHLGHASVAIEEARKLLGARALISVAAHSIPDLERAALEGAYLALLSPIFTTPGKGAPLGLDALKRARAMLPSFPIYALGGVDTANAASCLRAGASGIAAIRAIFDADDPQGEMKKLVDAASE